MAGSPRRINPAANKVSGEVVLRWMEKWCFQARATEKIWKGSISLDYPRKNGCAEVVPDMKICRGVLRRIGTYACTTFENGED